MSFCQHFSKLIFNAKEKGDAKPLNTITNSVNVGSFSTDFTYQNLFSLLSPFTFVASSSFRNYIFDFN